MKMIADKSHSEDSCRIVRGEMTKVYHVASVANNAAATERGNLSASTIPLDILTIIYGAL